MTIEVAIEYWGDHEDTGDESFWTKEAMQRAISQLWLRLRKTDDTMPDFTVALDRKRGVVVLSTN